MTAMRRAIRDYLSLRRALGFVLRDHEVFLYKFASFLEQEGASILTAQLALRWATKPQKASPVHWAQRLGVIRGFAQYLSAIDPRTETPSTDLLPHRCRRRSPRIFTQEELVRLVHAAERLRSKKGLRRWTYSTLFGLLTVTGLRISEVRALNCEDVDFDRGLLVIRKTKFGATRLIPIHPSTQNKLRQYMDKRRQVGLRSWTEGLFASEQGRRLTAPGIRYMFLKLAKETGLWCKGDRYRPRVHDLRHTFAVRTIIGWYHAGLDVESHMPVLSTYLGHVSVANTYWYLTGTPELVCIAATRLEQGLGDSK